MQVWQIGDSVEHVQFLPGSDRILVRSRQKDKPQIHVCSIDGEQKVPFDLPNEKLDRGGFRTGIDPTNDRCYLGWKGKLIARRLSDGSPYPFSLDVDAHEVVLSPDGKRLIAVKAGQWTPGQRCTAADITEKRPEILWKERIPSCFDLAGFLPDGERFVSIHHPKLQIRNFEDGGELSSTRYQTWHASHSTISPGGRWLGTIGNSQIYFFDLHNLDKPTRLAQTRGGNYIAFHPDEQTVALLHDAPTLVKIHELPSMKKKKVLRWKVGHLSCITFSADGMLGAAGSEDGRVVIWDMDD